MVRFNAPDLHEQAMRVGEAGGRALAAEAAHFEELLEAALKQAEPIAAAADALARLDVAAALAERAAEGGWCRPRFDEASCFEVEAGRHPVVEEALKGGGARFVANDCALSEDSRLWLVTGPNMGGKSTFLRQNALIILLAQAGSYVPAARAQLGLVDRLFSRVGASDNLARGRSTFMVEMVETAAILAQAGPRSFVILDEVGRGTSTYDGLAIAWAVVEAIHDKSRCRCLFATHYHELTRLAERLDALSLHHVRAREWKGDLVLLHEVADGPADRSYGIAVAKLAGLPPPVLARAKSVLAKLEQGRAATGGIAAGLDDLPLFAAAATEEAAPDPVLAALARDRAGQPRSARGAGADLPAEAAAGGAGVSAVPGQREIVDRRVVAERLDAASRERSRRDPQGGAGGRPRRDRPAARGAALCGHRGCHCLCLPDRPDPSPRLRFRHHAAPPARQPDHVGAAAADGGGRLRARRDGAPFGRRHRLRHPLEGDRLDRDGRRDDPLSALGSGPQGRP